MTPPLRIGDRVRIRTDCADLRQDFKDAAGWPRCGKIVTIDSEGLHWVRWDNGVFDMPVESRMLERLT